MTLTITDHGTWTRYVPADLPEGAPPHTLFCRRDSDGVDWYDFLRSDALSPDTVKMTVLPVGDQWIVQAVSADPSMLFPQSCRLIEVSGIADPDPKAAYSGKVYDPVTKTFYVPQPPLTEVAAQARYERETGGITVDGLLIATDRQSQAMISSAYNVALRDPNWSTVWKTADNIFVTLTAAQLIGVALAVSKHVEACFAKEAEVVAKITSGEITTPEQVQEAINAIPSAYTSAS